METQHQQHHITHTRAQGPCGGRVTTVCVRSCFLSEATGCSWQAGIVAACLSTQSWYQSAAAAAVQKLFINTRSGPGLDFYILSRFFLNRFIFTFALMKLNNKQLLLYLYLFSVNWKDLCFVYKLSFKSLCLLRFCGVCRRICQTHCVCFLQQVSDWRGGGGDVLISTNQVRALHSVHIVVLKRHVANQRRTVFNVNDKYRFI